MSSTPGPDAQRPPQLSEHALRQALSELDAKIQTLHNRAHATAAGSPNTYQAHAEALEAKRARLAQQLVQAPADGSEPSVWAQILRGIESLREDLRNIL
ncbi:hypothetical protein Q3A66_20675 [Hymenobacter sp. BT770]|uniref:hypothetical protein n=1 Tax=Hymenobacter sp. BT770 TaxID=2886942 RepID=UPI001D108799|nr:hypothetical protein [Hymenobacter sp. BT770]MCC3155483.1 hypothetical protein [Hymenobacter sp. BT770]MDO3417490.1 hypothetical protein [Hymenobacter sp. BT770]